MSAIENPERQTESTLADLPEFELEFLFDDDEDPSEVTVFVDEPAALSTNWITVDVENAVPLEEIR